MSKENVLYIFMNKNFEFTDEQGNITEDIFEAAGYGDLETARKKKKNLMNQKSGK